MKLDAGGKFIEQEAERRSSRERRQHARLCAVQVESITASATAIITHTPAARPSTPSEKLTTFIIATRPITVQHRPRVRHTGVGGSGSLPTNGSVIALTATPKCNGNYAAATCPASLTIGGRSKRSSSAPTSVISAAARSTPCQYRGAPP